MVELKPKLSPAVMGIANWKRSFTSGGPGSAKRLLILFVSRYWIWLLSALGQSRNFINGLEFLRQIYLSIWRCSGELE
jgi:hypothetical protein